VSRARAALLAVVAELSDDEARRVLDQLLAQAAGPRAPARPSTRVKKRVSDRYTGVTDERIAALIKRIKGSTLSQRELARRAGCTAGTLSRLCNGWVLRLEARTADAIEAVLDEQDRQPPLTADTDLEELVAARAAALGVDPADVPALAGGRDHDTLLSWATQPLDALDR